MTFLRATSHEKLDLHGPDDAVESDVNPPWPFCFAGHRSPAAGEGDERGEEEAEAAGSQL